MKSKNKLGEISEIIGKFLFYSSVVILLVAIITISLSKIDGKDIINFEDSRPPETFEKVGILIGNLIVAVIIYYFLKALFKPIYNLNKNIQLRLNNELSEKEFSRRWEVSLICSLIFGLLFIIGTFGVSFLLMIPHYMLLQESRSKMKSQVIIKPDSTTNTNHFIGSEFQKIKPNFKTIDFSQLYDLKKLTEKEILFVSTGVGLVISICFGSIFCKTRYYNIVLNRKAVEVSKEMSNFELCKFNYTVAIVTFIIIAGVTYIYLKRKKEENN